MSLAEEIIRLPAPPLAPQQPKQRAPRRDPRVSQRRRMVAAVCMGTLWCIMAAAGIWVASRYAQANQVAKEITALQDQLRGQTARNIDLQAQIVGRSNMAYVDTWAQAHGMHQPSAAQLQVMSVDKAQVNQKPGAAPAPLAQTQLVGGVFGWLGQVFQSVKGALSAHK